MKKETITITASRAERYFIERSFEMLDGTTIDLYRIRLHNSISLLSELAEVTFKYKYRQLKHHHYIDNVAQEVQKSLFKDEILNWGLYSKEYFCSLLRDTQRNTDKIYIVAKTLLKYNTDYNKKLYEALLTELETLNKEGVETTINVRRLSKLLSSTLVALRNKGFSKEYIRGIFKSACQNEDTTFSDLMEAMQKLLVKEVFQHTVVVHLSLKTNKLLTERTGGSELSADELADLKTKVKEDSHYLLNRKSGSHVSFNVEALDFNNAVKKMKALLHPALDVMHMGRTGNHSTVYHKVLVYTENGGFKDGIRFYNYQIDGYYNRNQKVYDEVEKMLVKIDNNKIDENAKNKIVSGLRYYRLGSESSELQTKLLDYWIGVEYIFSAFDTEEGTTARLKRYYTKMQGLVLFKRMLIDFHQSLKSLQLSDKVPNYHPENLEYLFDRSSYDVLIADFADHPLISDRAENLQNLISSPEAIRAMIQGSAKNVEWNLTRIYRIRNEIVHNASTNIDVEVLVSHLKYYLVFSLFSILDFFANRAEDYNLDNKIDIDDFFEIREMKYDNFFGSKKSEPDIEKLKLIMNPLEFLT